MKVYVNEMSQDGGWPGWGWWWARERERDVALATVLSAYPPE